MLLEIYSNTINDDSINKKNNKNKSIVNHIVSQAKKKKKDKRKHNTTPKLHLKTLIYQYYCAKHTSSVTISKAIKCKLRSLQSACHQRGKIIE